MLARFIDVIPLALLVGAFTLIINGLLVRGERWNMETQTIDPASGGTLASILIALFTTLVYFGYEFLMLQKGGQTLGKMAMRTRVVMVGGSLAPGGLPVEVVLRRAGVLWGGSLLTMVAVGGFPLGTLLFSLFALVNVLWQFWDRPLQQCLHDKVAQTVVVKVP
ncbi:RDD family protein [Sinosporangium siamense]|uniref:RDD family protein n=1 Tax=Sinosporangium siamense TaxID=1367973 RepID=A0A919RLA7_9ACTN|nr:RDD family protein [Sinosporangium siamense]